MFIFLDQEKKNDQSNEYKVVKPGCIIFIFTPTVIKQVYDYYNNNMTMYPVTRNRTYLTMCCLLGIHVEVIDAVTHVLCRSNCIYIFIYTCRTLLYI